MKKNLFFASLMALGMSLGMVSCGDDNNNSSSNNNGGATAEEIEAQNTDYTAENAKAWGNYAYNVAMLLNNDANSLYNAWTSGDAPFADQFKNHTSGSGYSSAENCVEEIFQGCIDIASEVGTAKIGEPVDYYKSGLTNKALYAVESWYSWHSRDDYKNNILSIANSYLGTRINLNGGKLEVKDAITNQAAANSLYTILSNKEATEWDAEELLSSICNAWQAIDNIPQPFRNNIGSNEAVAAMEACSDLEQQLSSMKAKVEKALTETEAQNIVKNYVDNVVVPTYSDLKTQVGGLLSAIQEFQKNPSNSNFEEAAQAWLAARAPWETSEAFLFGPVAKLGLDPNMDSWPLDPIGITNLLKSQKWSDMQWSGDYDEEDEAIEAAQSLRGFHTLEFLIFKNGKARKVN